MGIEVQSSTTTRSRAMTTTTATVEKKSRAIKKLEASERKHYRAKKSGVKAQGVEHVLDILAEEYARHCSAGYAPEDLENIFIRKNKVVSSLLSEYGEDLDRIFSSFGE